MFSAGVNGGECKSIRLAGGASTCMLALAVLGPGAPTGGEGGGVGAFPLADALEDDGVEEPASVGATESEVPPRSGLVLLFLLLLQPLLGYSVMKSDE